MNLGLFLLSTALGTLDTMPTESQPQVVQEEIVSLQENLNAKIAQVQDMIKELEKKNFELKAQQEQNALLVEQEVHAINKKLLQENQKYLQAIQDLEKRNAQHTAMLEKNLELMHEKVARFDRKEMISLSTEVGDLVAAVTRQEANMQASETPSLAIFHYRPEIKQAGGYVGVEFLWWKVYEGALDYAIKGQTGSKSPPQRVGAIGKLESASFDWDPGYRIYGGYRFRPDFWEVEAIYTYYHSSHTDKSFPPEPAIISFTPPSTLVPPEKTLVGTFVQFSNTALREAVSTIRLNYNMVDLLLARRFLASDAIVLRFLLGGTGAWIDQDWHYTYLPGSFFTGSVDDGVGSTINGKEDWDFSGGGLRIGLDSDWFIGKGFSLLSETSFALIYGNYSKLSFNFTNNHLPAGVPPILVPQVINDLHIHDHRFVFHLRLALMPAWGREYRAFKFLLYAGYELNFFANLNEVSRPGYFSVRPIDGRELNFTYGFLGIQGLTAGVKFDF